MVPGRESPYEEVFDRGWVWTSWDAQLIGSVLVRFKGSSDVDKVWLKRDDMMQSDSSRTAEISIQMIKNALIIQSVITKAFI